MSRLNNLKNNPKGIEALNKMIGSSSPHQWMTDTLLSMEQQEELLPWKKLLLNYEEDVRILAMHKDSTLRFHGCSILLYSQNENSRRHLWEMFRDSDRKIRKMMVNSFKSADRHRLYNTLLKIYLNDPVPEVRKSAYKRIGKDFSDLYSIQVTALSLEEKIHCLELLNTKSSHDHNLALQLMNDPQPGVVLAASLYLEKAGTLDALIQKARLRNIEDLNNRISILQIAVDHQIIAFLEKKENLINSASLYTALSLYESGIHSNLFSWTLQQIFDLSESKAIYADMKKRAVQCLAGRKDPDSLILIRDLLLSSNSDTLPYLLENLPPEAAVLYYPVLKDFIKDIKFPYTESLFKAFKSIPVNLCLSDLFALIRNWEINIEVRRRSLIILSSFCEYSCTLFMLENLNILKKVEMKDLAESLSSWNRKAFEKNVSIIFSQTDATLHQSLMELLASAGEKSFISVIEEKLLSPEAMTRITALHSLKELESIQSIEKMKGLFYDSDLPVRAHTAAVFIEWDLDDCFGNIQELLCDIHESPEIQNIILLAAEKSKNLKLIPIIAHLLGKDIIPDEKLITTMKKKTSFDDIRILTNLYGDMGTSAKKSMHKLFIEMGTEAEISLMSLLRKNICSADIKNILNNTGYVDQLIIALKSPFIKKRKTAVEDLCLISTQKACRGLLISSRDISSELRKMSLQALDQAQESSGMLSLLKEDNDKKTKRLALWAESKIKKTGS